MSIQLHFSLPVLTPLLPHNIIPACAPQPTEDSSSSPEDGPNNYHNTAIRGIIEGGGVPSNVLSDSDTGGGVPGTLPGIPAGARTSCTRFPLSTVRPDVTLGNFESDSLNETFSPARPSCARRKRKFKRMAVEYDTTATPTSLLSSATPLALSQNTSNMFSVDGKERVQVSSGSYGGVGIAGGGGQLMNKSMPRYGGSCQEQNFRANLFFCGKRKRSHRDRYDYDNNNHSRHHHHNHSSSVPRGQRGNLFSSVAASNGGNPLTFNSRASYLEHINRNQRPMTIGSKIQPLHKNIISRIERMDSGKQQQSHNNPSVPRPECEFKPIENPAQSMLAMEKQNHCEKSQFSRTECVELDEDDTMVDATTTNNNNNNILIPGGTLKSGSLESNFSFQEYGGSCSGNSGLGGKTNSTGAPPAVTSSTGKKTTKRNHTRRNHERHKRSALAGMQLQFDDPSDCPMEDILSSSSISSSDSETDKTCDSDREGDDELTDWPGNEGNTVTSPIGLVGGAELKRTTNKTQLKLGGGGTCKGLSLIKAEDTQDEDTRMSADELGRESMRLLPVVLPLKPGFVPVQLLSSVDTMTGSTGTGVSASRVPPPQSMPIDMPAVNVSGTGGQIGGGSFVNGGIGPTIESEMSGETSNHFLSSPNGLNEIREFRAGCRRVREERPSFSVITSVNEDLSR